MKAESTEDQVWGSAVKATIGFLNARGGSILFGVDDDGTVLGVERDIEKCGNRDGLIRFATNRLNSILGESATSHIEMDYAEEGSKVLLIWSVRPCIELCFVPKEKYGLKPDVLYVRQNANVEPLSGHEMIKYSVSRKSV